VTKHGPQLTSGLADLIFVCLWAKWPPLGTLPPRTLRLASLAMVCSVRAIFYHVSQTTTTKKPIVPPPGIAGLFCAAYKLPLSPKDSTGRVVFPSTLCFAFDVDAGIAMYVVRSSSSADADFPL